MKKSCDNCKAQELNHCSLGFKTQEAIYPLEDCPKPNTYNKFMYLFDLKNQGLTKEELIAISK